MKNKDDDDMDLDITDGEQQDEENTLIDVPNMAAELFATKPYYMWDEVRNNKKE